jgi:hypothetical protein
MNLVGSNPVFGLNALGGALSVELKNGFTYHGGEVTAYGGTFRNYGGEVQYGVQSGNVAAYRRALGALRSTARPSATTSWRSAAA